MMTHSLWKKIFWPCLIGVCCASLALISWNTLGHIAGGSLGVLAGGVAGGLGCWTLGRSLERRIEARLDELVAPRSTEALRASLAQSAGASASTARNGVDRRLDALGHTLERLRSTQAEFDEVESLARSLWQAIGDSTNGSSESRGGVLGLLTEVRSNAERLSADARALDKATEQIASGAWDQSDTVVRTTSTVEVLSDKIDQISHNAEAAAEAGQRARQEARRGIEQVNELIEGIDRLRAHVESNGRKVRRLGDRSVEIGAIVDLIDGISGRTDMLALNATIESVRAGEHGRGFAVVAEEIRKLAERTAAATREIGALVEAIQADTHESIAALGEEQAEVEQEAQRMREAGAALERISEVAEHSALLVEGISRSANDQVHSTHDLVRAMQRISEVTQQTQSGSAQLREHVRLLTDRCDRLRRLSTVEGQPSNGPAHRTTGVNGSRPHGGAGGNGHAQPRRRNTPIEQQK
ncbi:MAG TPA: methyl-accepting chemotaxis protein [Isosphaeraceae bacterium]|nr:methyl-accepting chemotaxis protein [Isosphaeraceae bacterium]